MAMEEAVGVLLGKEESVASLEEVEEGVRGEEGWGFEGALEGLENGDPLAIAE